MALKSRRPKNSPSAHTETELDLIKRMLKRNGNYGLAEVYVKGQRQGYSRSFESMCRQIRQREYKKVQKRRKSIQAISERKAHIREIKFKETSSMCQMNVSAFQVKEIDTIRLQG